MLALSFFESPLPFVAAVGHPPLQEKSSPFPRARMYTRYSKSQCHRERTEHFRSTYEASVLLCVLLGEGSVLRYVSHRTKPYRCAYYDRSATTVREQTFDGYWEGGGGEGDIIMRAAKVAFRARLGLGCMTAAKVKTSRQNNAEHHNMQLLCTQNWRVCR